MFKCPNQLIAQYLLVKHQRAQLYLSINKKYQQIMPCFLLKNQKMKPHQKQTNQKVSKLKDYQIMEQVCQTKARPYLVILLRQLEINKIKKMEVQDLMHKIKGRHFHCLDLKAKIMESLIHHNLVYLIRLFLIHSCPQQIVTHLLQLSSLMF